MVQVAPLPSPNTVGPPLLNLKKLWSKEADQPRQGAMSYERDHRDFEEREEPLDEDRYEEGDELGRQQRRSSRYRDEVYSKRVPAGKRTYFFDVKTTRSGEDFFITITESKRLDETHYEKHKIFLYKEDFAKFIGAMNEVVQFVKEKCLPDYDFHELSGNNRSDTDRSY
jgi:hypothetical protein